MSNKDENREAFLRVKEKSEDDFEKNIVYISAGTLVLSLTFIEKIVDVQDSNALWVLVIAWTFLALTLIGNLLSHHVSSYFHDLCANEYDDGDENLIKNINKRNRILRIWNIVSISTLFIGITFLIVFSSINIYNI